MSLFPRPKVTPNLPLPPAPAPLTDPSDPRYLSAAVSWLAHRWRKSAEALLQEAAATAASATYDEDRHDKELKQRTVAECYLRQAWYLEAVAAGRLVDLAKGTLVYPNPV